MSFPSLQRVPITCAALLLLVCFVSCTSTNQQRNGASSDPRLQKRENESNAIHGEVGVLYGRSG